MESRMETTVKKSFKSTEHNSIRCKAFSRITAATTAAAAAFNFPCHCCSRCWYDHHYCCNYHCCLPWLPPPPPPPYDTSITLITSTITTTTFTIFITPYTCNLQALTTRKQSIHAHQPDSVNDFSPTHQHCIPFLLLLPKH